MIICFHYIHPSRPHSWPKQIQFYSPISINTVTMGLWPGSITRKKTFPKSPAFNKIYCHLNTLHWILFGFKFLCIFIILIRSCRWNCVRLIVVVSIKMLEWSKVANLLLNPFSADEPNDNINSYSRFLQ